MHAETNIVIYGIACVSFADPMSNACADPASSRLVINLNLPAVSVIPAILVPTKGLSGS